MEQRKTRAASGLSANLFFDRANTHSAWKGNAENPRMEEEGSSRESGSLQCNPKESNLVSRMRIEENEVRVSVKETSFRAKN